MNPRLSLILCSRNDAYMGDSRWRLETTLNYVGDRVQACGRERDVEVLVTDWGSDVPLRDVIRLTPAASAIVSFLTVPPALVRMRQRDSPFSDALALNVAARRARGRYFGRIDQDTLVGERFLRWFFETLHHDDRRLFFSNRRDIPYRLAVRTPHLTHVTTFIRLFGRRLPVLREPHAAGDLYWTGAVGIWLTHRECWDACGGYDERLIYYNWMETDMICRLRPAHALVDLGELIEWDFYHLDHFDPRTSYLRRQPRAKNAAVDPNSTPNVLHPNDVDWGLNQHSFARERGTVGLRVGARGSFALILLRLAADRLVDRLVVFGNIQHYRWGSRYARAAGQMRSQAVRRWPAALWRLWRNRSEQRMRRMAGARWSRLRRMATAAAGAIGVLGFVRRLRARITVTIDRDIRRLHREDRRRFTEFTRDYGDVIAQSLSSGNGHSKTALVVSSRCPTIEGELCTIKTLQMAGHIPVVLLEDERKGLRPFYEAAGVRHVHLRSEFLGSSDYSDAAEAMVAECRSVDDLMTCTYGGVRTGMIAVCSALRRLHLGALDLHARTARQLLIRAVAASMSAMEEAERVLRRIRPELVLTDTEYTPKGELFETCLSQGIDIVTQDMGHRRNALMLKRYSPANRDQHLTTLSARSWSIVRGLEWTAERRTRLADEIANSYAAGDWFETPWSAAHGLRDPSATRALLDLDPGKKSAFVFPDVLWDAPVMWGKPLFNTYQEWFVETIAAACRNTEVNWVIKIHPAHVVKRETDPDERETAEMRALHDHVGPLPSHIKIVAPDAPVSTFSLFPVMDYCVTVRGTVGVEAARLGIPVLTAGPARYSELGFTIDSATRTEYLARLTRIQDVPPLSAAQRELAERFAYGLFVLRPLKLASVTWDPPRVRLNVKSADDWRRAPDLRALADWLVSTDEDFLATAEC